MLKYYHIRRGEKAKDTACLLHRLKHLNDEDTSTCYADEEREEESRISNMLLQEKRMELCLVAQPADTGHRTVLISLNTPDSCA